MDNKTAIQLKLKDYLHLYIGANYIIEGVDSFKYKKKYPKVAFSTIAKLVHYNGLKLILRKLTDATREEAEEFDATKEFQLATPAHMIGCMMWTAKSFKWLLDNKFNIFGLIDAGLAIDATILNKE